MSRWLWWFLFRRHYGGLAALITVLVGLLGAMYLLTMLQFTFMFGSSEGPWYIPSLDSFLGYVSDPLSAFLLGILQIGVYTVAAAFLVQGAIWLLIKSLTRAWSLIRHALVSVATP